MEAEEKKIVYDALRYLDKLNSRLVIAITIVTCVMALCFSCACTAVAYYYFTTDYGYATQTTQINQGGGMNAIK